MNDLTKTPVKYSHQREAVLSFLRTRKDHPTADTVYNHIRVQIPTISLGTVYRNLNQLANAGVILRLPCDGKTDRYDADIHPHCHLMCNCCGGVFDIMMDPTEKLMEDASDMTVHTIDTASVMFFGTCAACSTKL